MKFSSNTELARHLIQKFMSDGEVHSKSDIIDYVFSESKKYELRGDMTLSIVSNAIQKMLYNDKKPFIAVSRGEYKLLI